MRYSLVVLELLPEPLQTLQMESFAVIVQCFKPVFFVANLSILDSCVDPDEASESFRRF